MKLAKLSLCLAIGLAVLVGAAPTSEDESSDTDLVPLNITINPAIASTAGYDPSFDYHGYALAEMWVGRTPMAVGNRIGSDLYGVVYAMLEAFCPATSQSNSCTGGTGVTFDTYTMGKTYILVEDGHWTVDETRRLLIGSIAGAMEYMTYADELCNDETGVRNCMVGDIYRINLPDLDGEKNCLHVGITNYRSPWSNPAPLYDCCGTRHEVDSYLDTLADKEVGIWTTWAYRFHREVRCIIDGMDLCP